MVVMFVVSPDLDLTCLGKSARGENKEGATIHQQEMTKVKMYLRRNKDWGNTYLLICYTACIYLIIWAMFIQSFQFSAVGGMARETNIRHHVFQKRRVRFSYYISYRHTTRVAAFIIQS